MLNKYNIFISKRKWNKLYKQEIANIINAEINNDDKQQIIKLIDNQLEYSKQHFYIDYVNRNDSNNQIRFLEFQIGCQVARKLITLPKIFGIQPSQSNANVVYQIDHNRNIAKYPTLATTRELQFDLIDIEVTSNHLSDIINVQSSKIVDYYVELFISQVRNISNISDQKCPIDRLETEIYKQLQLVQRFSIQHANVVIVAPNLIDQCINQLQVQPTITTINNDYLTLQSIGTFSHSNNRVNLYSSVALINQVIVGYNGDNAIDSAFIFSPYIPFIIKNDKKRAITRVGFVKQFGNIDSTNYYKFFNVEGM